MSVFKVRREVLAQGGLKVGSVGTSIDGIMFGTAAFVCGSMTTGSSASTTASITNLPVSASIIAMPGTTTGSLMLIAVKAASAGIMGASFGNFSGSTADSKTINVTYLAVW